MKRILSAAAIAVMAILLLCGCAPGPINQGETYLDGAWYFSDETIGLNVGYNFFPDGGGYQFIGSTVNPIRYGVYEGNIYIAVGDGGADVFSFARNGEHILIGGLEYLYAPEDAEAAESIEAILSKEEENAPSGETGGVLFYVTALLAFGVVIFLVVWVARTFRKKV